MLAGAQVIKMASTPLIKLISQEGNFFPIPECFDDNKEDILECYTTSNLTKYLKAPMMIVQSPYD